MVSAVRDWYALDEIWGAYGIDQEKVKAAAENGEVTLWYELSGLPCYVIQLPPTDIRYRLGRDDDFHRIGGVVELAGYLKLSESNVYWDEVEFIGIPQAVESDLHLHQIDHEHTDMDYLYSASLSLDINWAPEERGGYLLSPERARNIAFEYVPVDGYRLQLSDCLVRASDISMLISLGSGSTSMNLFSPIGGDGVRESEAEQKESESNSARPHAELAPIDKKRFELLNQLLGAFTEEQRSDFKAKPAIERWEILGEYERSAPQSGKPRCFTSSSAYKKFFALAAVQAVVPTLGRGRRPSESSE